MCGIAGIWNPRAELTKGELREIAWQMSVPLHHRGPDGQGVWADETAGVALAHRRLAIIDTSEAGHQPMTSGCDRYVIAFNGEVYNFGELKHQLKAKGHSFRGHSDTEVVLAAITEWGIASAIERFNGMFAFALWDRQERCLHLGRDRFGEKPLYYGWIDQTLFLASELKALKAMPGFNAEIDRTALALYLQKDFIPAPYSIYEGIYKLTPGTFLSWDGTDSGTGSGPLVQPVPYWSVRETIKQGLASPFQGTAAEATNQLEKILRDSVKIRMVADVPLGAFLSGGIDSSVVVALMQSQSDRPVKTFTMGFHDSQFNEAPFAKEISQYLGTEHTELFVTPKDALDVIPKLPQLYDEPFSDPSQMPTFLVSQLARQSVTVSLSGDAGDELFTGYSRYFLAQKMWQQMGRMPLALRSMVAGGVTSIAPGAWDRLFKPFASYLPGRLKKKRPGDQLHKLAAVLGAPSRESLYNNITTRDRMPQELGVSASTATATLPRASISDLPLDFTHHMMALDTLGYLPDDILVKLDRASMGVSLESRVPLLDHRVAEFAWRLPHSMKVVDGKGKWILRQVLFKYVPPELIERPKMGFSVPIASWLRHELRDWAEALLDEQRLKREGFFDPQPIRQRFAEHCSGVRDWNEYLWNILMFQAWLEENS